MLEFETVDTWYATLLNTDRSKACLAGIRIFRELKKTQQTRETATFYTTCYVFLLFLNFSSKKIYT